MHCKDILEPAIMKNSRSIIKYNTTFNRNTTFSKIYIICKL